MTAGERQQSVCCQESRHDVFRGAAKKQWQQFWVGTGGALELAGGLNDQGEMVLTGHVTGRDGKERINRITWTPNPDGTVRQHWQSSTDGSATWTTVFDGIYRRKGP